MTEQRAHRDLWVELTLDKVMNLSTFNPQCRSLMSLAVPWDFYPFQNEANHYALSAFWA